MLEVFGDGDKVLHKGISVAVDQSTAGGSVGAEARSIASGQTMTTLMFVTAIRDVTFQVTTSTVGNQIGVVDGSGDGDGTGTATISVAEVVGHGLEIISGEASVIPENVVTGRTRGTLKKK